MFWSFNQKNKNNAEIPFPFTLFPVDFKRNQKTTVRATGLRSETQKTPNPYAADTEEQSGFEAPPDLRQTLSLSVEPLRQTLSLSVEPLRQTLSLSVEWAPPDLRRRREEITVFPFYSPRPDRYFSSKKSPTRHIKAFPGKNYSLHFNTLEEKRFVQHFIPADHFRPSFSLRFCGMEGMVKKYQQKFRKVKDEMSQWDELQSRLLSQFRNASSIIERLQLIQNPKNYGPLKCVGGIEDAVLRKQMESLENILLSMNNTMKEFHSIVFFLEKTLRDGRQLVKGGSVQATPKQLQQRIGIKPCLAYCLDGLSNVYEMHHSEYLLKSSIVSALPALSLKPSGSDLGALQQLLVDQPNIPRDEVQLIFDIVFAEEIC